MKGIRVIRFTGSEVFHKPFECAAEVDELLCQTARKTLGAYREARKLEEPIAGDAA